MKKKMKKFLETVHLMINRQTKIKQFNLWDILQ